jgi:outer membrane protein OmpU
MKKVLLTTTALVMTAGVAAADVSFSGSAQTGISSVNGADNALTSHIDFNVAVSTTTENGVSLSTSFGYDAGNMIDTGDMELDGEEANETNNAAWSTGAPEITIGYNGYTISAQPDGVDNLFDDDQAEDLGVSGSMGGVSFGATGDLERSASSYKLGYTMGDLSVTLTGTSNDDDGGTASKVAATYKMGDLTLSAASTDASDDDKDDSSVGFTYAMDGITVAYTMINPGDADMGDEWDASVAYSAGALSAKYSIDEADVTKLTATYDLGGASVFFANQTATGDDFQAVGINFAF